MAQKERPIMKRVTAMKMFMWSCPACNVTSWRSSLDDFHSITCHKCGEKYAVSLPNQKVEEEKIAPLPLIKMDTPLEKSCCINRVTH